MSVALNFEHSKRRFFVCFFLFLSIDAFSQECISSSGETLTSTFGSISYTIGQISNENNASSTFQIQEGVQQVFTQNNSVQIRESQLDLGLIIYPNPCSDFIQIDFKEKSNSKYRYEIFNTEGRLMISGELNSKSTKLETRLFPSASYLLRVTGDDKILSYVFKKI